MWSSHTANAVDPCSTCNQTQKLILVSTEQGCRFYFIHNTAGEEVEQDDFSEHAGQKKEASSLISIKFLDVHQQIDKSSPQPFSPEKYLKSQTSQCTRLTEAFPLSCAARANRSLNAATTKIIFALCSYTHFLTFPARWSLYQVLPTPPGPKVLKVKPYYEVHTERTCIDFLYSRGKPLISQTLCT